MKKPLSFVSLLPFLCLLLVLPARAALPVPPPPRIEARAWLLIDALNTYFRRPVVAAQHGGKRGGGATLTDFGADVVKRYRRMEEAAARALRPDLQALAAERPVRPRGRRN